MCRPCEASKERLQAATALLERLECPQGYGIKSALKQLYKAEPLDDDWLIYTAKFNR